MQVEHVIAPLITIGFNRHCMRSIQAGDLTEATFFTFQTGEVLFAFGGCHYRELTDLHIHFACLSVLGSIITRFVVKAITVCLEMLLCPNWPGANKPGNHSWAQ